MLNSSFIFQEGYYSLWLIFLYNINTLFFDLLNSISYASSEFCIQNNQPSWILLVESYDSLQVFFP